MSNWKVGPGGRLYHPTTGAYVGQLDDNGNEQMVVSAFPSELGLVFDEATTAAIVAIAGDAGSGSAAQIVDGYPVEVTGTTEVLKTRHKLDPWVISAGVAFRF